MALLKKKQPYYRSRSVFGKTVPINAWQNHRCMVGLTQFLLWGVLTFTASTVTSSIMSGKIEEKVQAKVKAGLSKDEIKKFEASVKSENPLNSISDAIENVSLGKMIFCFISTT
jgi:hypothetical protein